MTALLCSWTTPGACWPSWRLLLTWSSEAMLASAESFRLWDRTARGFRRVRRQRTGKTDRMLCCPTDGACLISRSQRGQSGALTKAMPPPSQIGARVAVMAITVEPRPPLLHGAGA